MIILKLMVKKVSNTTETCKLPKTPLSDMASNPKPDQATVPDTNLATVPDTDLATVPDAEVATVPDDAADASEASGPEAAGGVALKPKPKAKRDQKGRKRPCCVPGCRPSGFIHHQIPAPPDRRAKWLMYVTVLYSPYCLQ